MLLICFFCIASQEQTTSPARPASQPNHYQLKFDAKRCNLASSLAELNRAWKISLSRDEGYGYYKVEISTNNASVDLQLKLHAWTHFAEKNGVLYYPEYHYMTSGCTVHAVDLRRGGKELWKMPLEGLKVKSHSKYSNAVNIFIVDNDIVIYAEEMFGKYIEVLDKSTGKQKSLTVVSSIVK